MVLPPPEFKTPEFQIAMAKMRAVIKTVRIEEERFPIGHGYYVGPPPSKLILWDLWAVTFKFGSRWTNHRRDRYLDTEFRKLLNVSGPKTYQKRFKWTLGLRENLVYHWGIYATSEWKKQVKELLVALKAVHAIDYAYMSYLIQGTKHRSYEEYRDGLSVYWMESSKQWVSKYDERALERGFYEPNKDIP